jgi:hypothetical protein
MAARAVMAVIMGHGMNSAEMRELLHVLREVKHAAKELWETFGLEDEDKGKRKLRPKSFPTDSRLPLKSWRCFMRICQTTASSGPCGLGSRRLAFAFRQLAAFEIAVDFGELRVVEGDVAARKVAGRSLQDQGQDRDQHRDASHPGQGEPKHHLTSSPHYSAQAGGCSLTI